MLLLREKRCVVSMHLGDRYNAMAEITLPSMRRYAAKIGADFHVITQQRVIPGSRFWPHVCWEKYQIADLMDTYSAILFLDVDCVVSSDCPNAFEVHPREGFVATKFAARSDIVPYARFCGLNNPQYEINSGVMLLRRSHRSIMNMPLVFPPPIEYILSEQDWWAINAQLQGLKVTPLHWMLHRGDADKPFWIFHAVHAKNKKIEVLRSVVEKRMLL